MNRIQPIVPPNPNKWHKPPSNDRLVTERLANPVLGEQFKDFLK